MSAKDCCRAPVVGADKKLFDDLQSVLDRLEGRGTDKVLMDLTVPTKKSLYDRLLSQAERYKSLL